MNKTEIRVTAKWAKETANGILGTKVKEQIEKCETNIIAAVKRNEMYCHVGIYADRLTIKELTSRGFECKQEDDQRNGSYLIIKWK